MPENSDRAPVSHVPIANGPSAWIVRFAGLVPPGGPVLDVACGRGRHTQFFLDRGHPVTAVDIDVSALSPAAGLELIEVDLERESQPWPFREGVFAAVVVTNYLWRPRLADIVAAVAPDGVLLYETFGEGNAVYGRPRNPNFLLAPGELLAAAASLQVVAYEHGVEPSCPPAVRQRICAVRAANPAMLCADG